MTTGTLSRCWLLGVVCVCATIAGCAAPAGINPASGLWSRWAESPPDRQLSKAERKLKDPVKLNLMYARFREEQGDVAEARQRYEHVLGEQPKSVDAILGLARLDQLAGRIPEAEQRFKQALALGSHDPHVLDAVGQYYASQRRWDEAVEILNSAMMTAPEDPTYRYHLAVALAQSGEVSRAMPHFAKTVGDAQAHYNIGYILYEQGRSDSAEQHFVQAVIKKPDLQQAHEMLDTIRRERENRLMLAGARADRPVYRNSLPSPQGIPHQPTHSAGLRTPNRQTVPEGAVNSMRSPPALPPSHQFLPSNGQLPGPQSRGYRPAPSGHSLGQSAGSLPQRTALPPERAVAQPPVSSGMTPQQLEQRNNQLGH